MRSSASFIAVIALLLVAGLSLNNYVLAQTGAAFSTTTTSAAPTTTTTVFTCAGSAPSTPFTCPDTSCAIDAAHCPCPAGQTRCGTNNACVTNTSDNTQCPCSTGLTACPDGSCATSCVTVCSGATPTRCGDGSCASTFAACPCLTAQWASAVITVAISTSTLTTVDVTVGTQVTAPVKAFACDSERTVSVMKNWTVTDLTNSAGSFTLTNAGSLNVDTTRFTAGHDYAVTVVAGITYPDVGASAPKGSTTWQFRATQPAPVVTIIGGSDFTLLTSTVLRRSVIITRGGVAANLPVTWSCACYSSNTGCTTCPAELNFALASTTSSTVSFANTTAIPFGKYVLTATVETASSSQVINVINGVVANPPPVVSIISPVPTEAQLLAPINTQIGFLANIQGDQTGATIQWYLNGNAVTSVVATANNILTLAKTSFTAGASNNVTISATRDGIPVSSSVFFMMPAAAVTGSCSVTGAATPIVGSQTFVNVSASFSGTTLNLQYGFYEQQSGDAFASSTTSGALITKTFHDYQSPLAKATSGSSTVTVHVDAVDSVSKLVLATATCTYTVVAPSAAAQQRLATEIQQQLNSTNIHTIEKSQLAIFATTLAILSASNPLLANTAMDALNASITIGVTVTASSATTTFSVLSTIAGPSTTSGTTTTTTTVAGQTPSPVVVDQTAVKALNILVSVTAPANSLDGAAKQVNVAAAGAAILNLIGTFAARVGGANADATLSAAITNATTNLARTLAAQAPPGVVSSVVAPDGKTQLFGTSVPAGNSSSNVTVAPPGAKGEVAFPSGFMGSLGDETATVSIGCAAWSGDAAGANRNLGAPAGSSAASDWTVDYSVSVNGQAHAVSGLSATSAIALSFSLTTTSGMVYSCYFFQVTTSTWSNDGLSGDTYSAGKLSCATTHLTQFTVFGAALPTTTTTTTAAPSNLFGSVSKAGAIAGGLTGAFVGVIIIVVIVLVVVKKIGGDDEAAEAETEMEKKDEEAAATNEPAAAADAKESSEPTA